MLKKLILAFTTMFLLAGYSVAADTKTVQTNDGATVSSTQTDEETSTEETEETEKTEAEVK